MVFLLIAVLFAGLSVDEWISYINGYPETSGSPVFNFTMFVIAIFIIYELLEWRIRRKILA
jgi:hypothetical protein